MQMGRTSSVVLGPRPKGLVLAHGTGGGVPYGYNIKASNTSIFRAAWAAQSGHVPVALIGDSTMRGVDDAASPTNSQYSSAPNVLTAPLLRAMGIPASGSSIFGIGGVSPATLTQLKAVDSRFDFAGSAAGSSQFSVGGNSFSLPSSGSTTSLVATDPVTKADFFSRDFASGRNFTHVESGTTITQTGAGTIKRSSSPDMGAPALRTNTLAWALGSPEVFGILAYNDTRPELQLMNWSVAGANQALFINNTGSPSAGWLRFYTLYPPKLAFVEAGVVNAWRNASISVATFKADLTTLVQALKTAGSDVILWAPPFDGGTAGQTANQNAYVTAMYEVALAEDVGLIDIRLRPGWRSYAEQISYGFVSAAGFVHPTVAAGYPDQAAVYAQTISRILRF